MMGTLLKTVSRFLVSGFSDTKSTKKHQSSGSSCCQDDASRVKRKSSEPEVDLVKRTTSLCDDEDDSGVEQDFRSPSEQNAPTDTNRKQFPDMTSSTSETGADRKQRGAQVGFDRDVIVHSAFIDDEGNRQSFCERGSLKMTSWRQERERDRDDVERCRRPEPPTSRTASVKSIVDPDVRYRIAREPRTGIRLLRFCVRLGPLFSGGATVMVKTNSAGNKIHLLAHRPPTSASSSSSDVYRDSFPLPVVVDPAHVTAVVDTDGRVLVEAPVVAPSDPLLERWFDRHPPHSTHKSHRKSKHTEQH